MLPHRRTSIEFRILEQHSNEWNEAQTRENKAINAYRYSSNSLTLCLLREHFFYISEHKKETNQYEQRRWSRAEQKGENQLIDGSSACDQSESSFWFFTFNTCTSFCNTYILFLLESIWIFLVLIKVYNLHISLENILKRNFKRKRNVIY